MCQRVGELLHQGHFEQLEGWPQRVTRVDGHNGELDRRFRPEHGRGVALQPPAVLLIDGHGQADAHVRVAISIHIHFMQKGVIPAGQTEQSEYERALSVIDLLVSVVFHRRFCSRPVVHPDDEVVNGEQRSPHVVRPFFGMVVGVEHHVVGCRMHHGRRGGRLHRHSRKRTVEPGERVAGIRFAHLEAHPVQRLVRLGDDEDVVDARFPLIQHLVKFGEDAEIIRAELQLGGDSGHRSDDRQQEHQSQQGGRA